MISSSKKPHTHQSHTRNHKDNIPCKCFGIRNAIFSVLSNNTIIRSRLNQRRWSYCSHSRQSPSSRSLLMITIIKNLRKWLHSLRSCRYKYNRSSKTSHHLTTILSNRLRLNISINNSYNKIIPCCFISFFDLSTRCSNRTNWRKIIPYHPTIIPCSKWSIK